MVRAGVAWGGPLGVADGGSHQSSDHQESSLLWVDHSHARFFFEAAGLVHVGVLIVQYADITIV